MGTYTVKQATATGKVTAKFGTEYIVHFNEDEREVKMSRQKPVEVGQEEHGTIVDSRYGAYFKKDPYNPDLAKTADPVKKQWAPMRKDNSDGMRQGMCMNNAANYVNSLDTGPLTPKDWAKAVYSFATELYELGDLGYKDAPEDIKSQLETPLSEAPKSVQEVFGVSK